MESITLVITNPKWLMLLQKKQATVMEVIRYSYRKSLQFKLSIYDIDKDISIFNVYNGRKYVGKIVYTPEKDRKLRCGEEVKFLLVD